MSIQKINSVGLNSLKRANTALLQKNDSRVNNQQNSTVSTRDMLYSYPISFGSAENNEAQALSFDDSVNSYMRFVPDIYQRRAAANVYEGSDSLFTAPTGTGKTLVGEYAINKNLEAGKTTFYTTPLKALSNEKYTDFCKLYGKENVGLMTGDIKINPQAKVVVMTTEIYRNMLVGDNNEDLQDRLKDVATVVYDEFHYMNEPERGEVWETSIMYTPSSVQQLLLSATSKNSDAIVKWMNRLLAEKGADKELKVVNSPEPQREAKLTSAPPEERYVPLKYYIFDELRSNRSIIPLATDKYDLQKLGKALNPDSKTHLSELQKQILTEVSEKAGEKPSPTTGLGILMKKTDIKGGIESLERTFAQKLGYSPLEAERAAAILADKAGRQMNESLKSAKSEKEQKSAFYSKTAPKKVISPDRVKDLLLANSTPPHNESRALMQYSRITGGDTTVKDGLEKISNMLNNTDMGVKEFEKRIKNTGLNDKLTDKIANLLTVTRYPDEVPEELDLINILEEQNKLPAIFFKFSKKNCNSLRDDVLKTGKRLLNDEEKELAAQIIKKHVEKGGFFGTGEDPATLLSGVAVHHAGMMPAYKALVEELAQNKLLKVVFATSTLGAGINVPAKTTVFTELTRYAGDSAAKNGEKFVPLTANEFQQMAGRAGRRGKDFIGNVVIMPDKDHGPQSIYTLVNSDPDPINSNFKPTYSFISHFIAEEGSAEKLPESVDKSFLRESLEFKGDRQPYKTMNKVKDQFKAMAKVLAAPEMECFTEKDGKLVPTIKGNIVSKARGVDGLVFAETLLKSGLEHLTPQDMAAVACALTQPDERDTTASYHLSDSVIDTLMGIDILHKKVETEQLKQKANVKPLMLNRAEAQYIAQWANVTDPEPRQTWEQLIKTNSKDVKGFNEGNFLKTVKDTVDILEQIKETSKYAADINAYVDNNYPEAKKMRNIHSIAKQAIELLKRDPVLYEL